MERCHYHCNLSAPLPLPQFPAADKNGGAMIFRLSTTTLCWRDILSQKRGRSRLLPPSGLMVFDEAHKLLDAARKMYGMVFCSTELEQVAASVAVRLFPVLTKRKSCTYAGEMLRLNTLLFETLKQGGRS